MHTLFCLRTSCLYFSGVYCTCIVFQTMISPPQKSKCNNDSLNGFTLYRFQSAILKVHMNWQELPPFNCVKYQCSIVRHCVDITFPHLLIVTHQLIRDSKPNPSSPWHTDGWECSALYRRPKHYICLMLSSVITINVQLNKTAGKVGNTGWTDEHSRKKHEQKHCINYMIKIRYQAFGSSVIMVTSMLLLKIT